MLFILCAVSRPQVVKTKYVLHSYSLQSLLRYLFHKKSRSLQQRFGNRGEVFSIGSAVSYNYQNPAAFHLKWEHELFAANRQTGRPILGRVSPLIAVASK